MFKNKLLTIVGARTNGQRHENWCIKRPSHLWRFRSISKAFFHPRECPGLGRHRPGHSLGGKRPNWAKPSEVAGSFYATVFMVQSVCFEHQLLLMIYFWTQWVRRNIYETKNNNSVFNRCLTYAWTRVNICLRAEQMFMIR